MTHKLKKGRRIYFDTEEITTVKKRGWIEIDEDFTQVYKSFNLLANKIDSPTSWKLLFWIMANASNDQNGVEINKRTFERFNKDHSKTISIATYYNSIDELCKAGAITKVGKGHYYLNPYIFWSADREARITFIQDEQKEGSTLSINPLKEFKLLDSKKNPG
jgi:hypothetical protein